jgi:hypothetical protein
MAGPCSRRATESPQRTEGNRHGFETGRFCPSRRVVEVGLVGPDANSLASRSSEACARRRIGVCAKLITPASTTTATGDSRLVPAPGVAGMQRGWWQAETINSPFHRERNNTGHEHSLNRELTFLTPHCALGPDTLPTHVGTYSRGQAVACPRATQKTATYRSLRSLRWQR